MLHTGAISAACSALILATMLANCVRPIAGEASCIICDNYFELNDRNLKDPSMAGRFCNTSIYLTGYRHTKCKNKDLNGCMKMTTKSWRYHIDRQGVGMKPAATLIATVITRDCAEIPPAMGIGCHQMYGAGTTKEICYCVGNACNASGRSAAFSLAGMAACIAIALLTGLFI